MSSLSLSNLVIDRLLSFSSKMKRNSLEESNALCLMNWADIRVPQHTKDLIRCFFNVSLTSNRDIDCMSYNSEVASVSGTTFWNNLCNNRIFSSDLYSLIMNSFRLEPAKCQMAPLPLNSFSLNHKIGTIFPGSDIMKKEYINQHLDCNLKSPDVSPIQKMSVSASIMPRKENLEMSEKCSLRNNFALNLELAHRKTKELNKRSKKRRRRQKKVNPTGSCHSTFQANYINSLLESDGSNSSSVSEDEVDINVSLSPASSHGVSVKTSECSKPGSVISAKHDTKMSPSIVSTFVVSVEIASDDDDDSDWDSCVGSDNLAETLDFELTGLFLANLSAPKSNSHSPSSETRCNIDSTYQSPEADMNLQAALVAVNKNWEECMKGIDSNLKSSPKVSFAPDEELVEILPVEMYDRKGEWERYATERLRFKRRIDELEKVFSYCLSPEHRSKVYKKITDSVL